MIDRKLLEILSGGHFGFGSYRAPLWLIGPGDILGTNDIEIAERLKSWHHRGQQEMDDLREFFLSSGPSPWFDTPPRLHRTWARLSRLVLASNGKHIADDVVRRYQADRFGRRDNPDFCMINVLPYHAGNPTRLFDRSGAANRPSLESSPGKNVALRIRHVRAQLARHKPRAVVFYDRKHRNIWEQVAGDVFAAHGRPSCHIGREADTLFLIIRHPESVGTKNQYFELVGELIASQRS